MTPWSQVKRLPLDRRADLPSQGGKIERKVAFTGKMGGGEKCRCWVLDFSVEEKMRSSAENEVLSEEGRQLGGIADAKWGENQGKLQ